MRGTLKGSTKTVLVVGGLGALGIGLYFLLRKRGPASDPSEWSPFPGLTFTPPRNLPCVCPTGFTPIRDNNGQCRCSPIQIEVLANLGGRCTKSAQCGSGNCINGFCVPESEVL